MQLNVNFTAVNLVSNNQWHWTCEHFTLTLIGTLPASNKEWTDSLFDGIRAIRRDCVWYVDVIDSFLISHKHTDTQTGYCACDECIVRRHAPSSRKNRIKADLWQVDVLWPLWWLAKCYEIGAAGFLHLQFDVHQSISLVVIIVIWLITY